MTTKRSKRKGGMKPKRKCDKCTSTEVPEAAHNAGEWYTRDIIPQVGSNFSVLTTLNPEKRLLTNGMYVNGLVHHECILTPPIDEHSSFHQKMLDLFTELREVNAGATNYDPVYLGAYCMNVITLRALIGTIRRMMAAVRYANALYRESPNIFIAAAGANDYATESAAYAQNYNDYALLCKDTENLPIPSFSLLDRFEFIFDKIFVDSNTTRPAMVVFMPKSYAITTVNSGAYVFTTKSLASPENSAATIADAIAKARDVYAAIIAEEKNVIIRGDMIKAFGAGAMKRNLVSQIDNHLSMGYSADVMSQLENTAIIGANASSMAISMSTTGGPASVSITRTSAETGYILDETYRIINFHGESAPRDGELLAITRLAITGVNGSTIEIQSTSGITVTYTKFMKVGTSGRTESIFHVAQAIRDTHSTIQSTVESAYKYLSAMLTLVDHFPMVLHHPGDPNGAILDVDNAAYISAATLADMTELANRSLMSAHIPRKSDGHYLR